MLLPSSLIGVISYAHLARALKPLTVQGSDFINPLTNARFQIVGVAYQPGGSAGFIPSEGKDPLTDEAACLRDAALMQALGVNLIRTYNVSPDLNHDACASIFNAAGIYMILDVNSPLAGQSLSSDAPWTSYDAAYLNRTFAVVEAFKNYPNTAAFFCGNEVIYAGNSSATTPAYIRAVTRDLKNYIAKHASRPIPVGYSAADIRNILFDSLSYLECSISGEAGDISRADLFAMNSYSWCAGDNLQTSSYTQLIAGFTGSSVPVFFSEYGCNTITPRTFSEVPVIYSDVMTVAFSGGIVYEFAQEANNYGLVLINDDGSATLRPDYASLKARYAALDFGAVQGAVANGSSVKAATCAASLIPEAGLTPAFASTWDLPALPPGAQEIMDNGVSPLPLGKIAAITNFKVAATVTDTTGALMTNLAVVSLANDAINSPGAAAASPAPPAPTTSSIISMSSSSTKSSTTSTLTSTTSSIIVPTSTSTTNPTTIPTPYTTTSPTSSSTMVIIPPTTSTTLSSSSATSTTSSTTSSTSSYSSSSTSSTSISITTPTIVTTTITTTTTPSSTPTTSTTTPSTSMTSTTTYTSTSSSSTTSAAAPTSSNLASPQFSNRKIEGAILGIVSWVALAYMGGTLVCGVFLGLLY